EALGRREGEAQSRMQEAAPTHETFARILAIDDAVEAREVEGAVALAAARRRILPRIGLRNLHALGRRRMRGEEIEHARVAADPDRRTQLGVAPHRGEESHGSVRIEAGAGRNPDPDAVRLELLATREARQRDLRFG